jgi:hypothetical protein
MTGITRDLHFAVRVRLGAKIWMLVVLLSLALSSGRTRRICKTWR